MGIGGSNSDGTYFLRHTSKADDRNAMYATKLKKIEVGDGVIVNDFTFSACYGLSDVVISDGVTSIGKYAFYNCYGISSVVIRGDVTNISDQLFYNCYNLSNAAIPDGVTSIGKYAFYNCYGISSVVIPNSVTSIGDSAFYSCYGVKFYDFTFCSAVPALSASNAFWRIPADCEIRVPAALVDEWKAATNWSSRADYIVGV